MNYSHKTILITGASRGIGKALAIQLAAHKANLVLASRDRSALKSVAQECDCAGGKAIVVSTAISSLTGKTGVPTRTGYAASKHALQGFFDYLRIELKDTRVDVLVVSPSFVATEIRNSAIGALDNFTQARLDHGEQQSAMPVEVCAEL